MDLSGPDSLKICRRGLQMRMFRPPKMSHSFIQNCYWITLQVSHHQEWKICVKMEGKTIFLRRLQKPGLLNVWKLLTLSVICNSLTAWDDPIFYDRSIPLVAVVSDKLLLLACRLGRRTNLGQSVGLVYNDINLPVYIVSVSSNQPTGEYTLAHGRIWLMSRK